MAETIQIGFVIFPRVTQLDFTGPLQVLSRVPGAMMHLVAKRIEPIASDTVLTITPTTTFAACPQLDVICVPGGIGTDTLLNDEETLDFLRAQAKAARYITSVCTGSLVLAPPACSTAFARRRTGRRWAISASSARRLKRPASAPIATASPAAA